MTFALFGYTDVIETSGDDPGAIGAAIQVGDYHMVRPPMRPARAAARLANGAGAYLTKDELADLDILSIDVVRGSDGKFRSVEPVRVRTWFGRAPR